MSAYDPTKFTVDLCENAVAVCVEVLTLYCPECSEDYNLELELDE